MTLPDVTADPDRDAMYALFERQPGDTAAYGAMADRLDEIGQHALAHAFRWMALRGKWPHLRTHYAAGQLGSKRGRKVPLKFRFAWYLHEVPKTVWPLPPGDLKAHVLPPQILVSDQAVYPSHQAAVMFLANRLALLRAVCAAEPSKGAGL